MSNKDSDDNDGAPGAQRLLPGGALLQLHMDRERRTVPDGIQQHQQQHQATTKRYQTLLPAVEASPITRSLATDPNRKLPPKRKLVLVACTRCRQKKEKVPQPSTPMGRDVTLTVLYSVMASALHAVAVSRRRRTASTKWTMPKSAVPRP